MDEDTDLGQVMVARSAQVASVVAMLAENTARMRASRMAAQAARSEAAARAARVAARAAAAQTRTTYGAALQPGWVATAPTMAAGRVWAAAVPHAGTDPYAARAQRAAETRLRELHPEGMRRYDELRAAGVDPRAAMREAVPLFLQPPGTPADEATTGRRAADQHTAAADTATAQASEPAQPQRWSFPTPARPTAPAAAAAVTAAAPGRAGVATTTPRPTRR